MFQSPDYRRVLTRGWWIALLAFATAILTCAAVTARQRPVYHASTSLVVAPSSQVEGTGDVLRSLETLERRSVIATFARIPATREAREVAAQRLGRDASELSAYRVDASVLPSTNILKIDVDGPDPRVAANIANTLAVVTKEEVRSLYRIFTLKSLAQAVPPSRPARPDRRRNYVVATILGLLLGVGAAFVADRVWKVPASEA